MQKKRNIGTSVRGASLTKGVMQLKRHLYNKTMTSCLVGSGLWLMTGGCQTVEPISPGPGDPSLREVAIAPATTLPVVISEQDKTSEADGTQAVTAALQTGDAAPGDVVVSVEQSESTDDPRGDITQPVQQTTISVPAQDSPAVVTSIEATAVPSSASVVPVAMPATGANLNLVGPPAPAIPVAQPLVNEPSEEAWAAEIIKQASDKPGDSVAQMNLQLLNYLKGRPIPEIGQLSSLSEEDRYTLMAVGDALSNFRSRAAESGEGSTGALRRRSAFIELSERLSQQSGQFSVAALALCSKVDSYGVYEPLMPGTFVQGRETPVIVYVELMGFVSRLTSKQLWETRLTQTLSLFSATGDLVWSEKPMVFVDSCRNKRKDFFLPRLVRMPAMPVGSYVLKVTMTDDASGKVAEASLSMEVK